MWFEHGKSSEYHHRIPSTVPRVKIFTVRLNKYSVQENSARQIPEILDCQFSAIVPRTDFDYPSISLSLSLTHMLRHLTLTVALTHFDLSVVPIKH